MSCGWVGGGGGGREPLESNAGEGRKAARRAESKQEEVYGVFEEAGL